MKIRAIRPTPDDSPWLDPLAVGDVSVVLGMSVRTEGIEFHIPFPDGRDLIGFMPAAAVEIIDDEVPPDWIMRAHDLSYLVGPAELHTEYLHDRLGDGDTDAIALFRDVRARYDPDDE